MSKLNSYHQLLKAQQFGLVHDGEGHAAGQKRDSKKDQHGPEVADLKQTGVIQSADKVNSGAHLQGLGLDDESVSVHGDGHVGQGGHIHRHTREGLHKPGQYQLYSARNIVYYIDEPHCQN